MDIPESPLVETKVADQLFYIEESDEWFFKGYNLVVDYDSELDEPKYDFNQV